MLDVLGYTTTKKTEVIIRNRKVNDVLLPLTSSVSRKVWRYAECRTHNPPNKCEQLHPFLNTEDAKSVIEIGELRFVIPTLRAGDRVPLRRPLS